MKEDIKAKWIAALKSGQYAQATKRLTDGHGFCCLGVLCNLYALEKGVMWVRSGGSLHLDGTSADSHNTEALPIAVQKWAGLNDSNPGFGGKGFVEGPEGHAYSLAECNDEGMTLAEVADVIAARL